MTGNKDVMIEEVAATLFEAQVFQAIDRNEPSRYYEECGVETGVPPIRAFESTDFGDLPEQEKDVWRERARQATR